MAQADVTICIPAWQAAAFIDRTLACARAQTHESVRILVSVDPSADETEEICQSVAREDSRIAVIAPEHRLGWSANANFLLKRIETEYFFLYFHDDIIEPDYVAALLEPLKKRHDAASAHCDIQRFGDRQEIQSGCAYDGPVWARLTRYLAQDVRGLMLRCLIRSACIEGGVHFPIIGGDGLWRVLPFETNLVAKGPALYVPRPLYRRWLRPGSMTATWHARTKEELIEGQRQCAELCLAVINGVEAEPRQRELLRFCLALRMLFRTRKAEADLAFDDLVDAAAISPLLADLPIPALVNELEPELKSEVLGAYGQLLWHEGMYALRRGDRATAALKLRASLEFDPSRRVSKQVADLLGREDAGGSTLATRS